MAKPAKLILDLNLKVVGNYRIFQAYHLIGCFIIWKMTNKKMKLHTTIPEIFDFLGDVSHAISGPAKPKVRDYILTKMKNTIVWSAVSLSISFFTIYMAIFRPFGNQASLWISSILFIAMLLWSIITFIRILTEYHMLPIYIIQKRSLSYGLEEFIKKQSKLHKAGFGIYKLNRIIGPFFSSKCKNIPSANSVVKDYINYLAKDIIVFASTFTLYVVLIHWIFKPLILEKFAGLTTMQIYLFPITQISQELNL